LSIPRKKALAAEPFSQDQAGVRLALADHLARFGRRHRLRIDHLVGADRVCNGCRHRALVLDDDRDRDLARLLDVARAAEQETHEARDANRGGDVDQDAALVGEVDPEVVLRERQDGCQIHRRLTL
jgi:hypothetical protein